MNHDKERNTEVYRTDHSICSYGHSNGPRGYIMCRRMRTGVAFGTAKPCCDIAKDLHVRGPPRILQQVIVVCNIIVIITIPLSGKRAWGRNYFYKIRTYRSYSSHSTNSLGRVIRLTSPRAPVI